MLGYALSPKDRFDGAWLTVGKSVTFGEAVSSGALQNSYISTTNDEFTAQVPRPSLFVLYAHVVALLDSPKSQHVTVWDFVAATCLRNMIEYVAAPIDGATFEMFHAHWHALVMLLYARRDDGDMDPLSLSAIDNAVAVYTNAIVRHGVDVKLDRLVPTPSNAVVQVSGCLSDAGRTVWHDNLSGKNEVPLVANQVVLPSAANNVGFDALVMHRTASGEPHLVLIECKNSKVDATTKLRYDRMGFLHFQCVLEFPN